MTRRLSLHRKWAVLGGPDGRDIVSTHRTEDAARKAANGAQVWHVVQYAGNYEALCNDEGRPLPMVRGTGEEWRDSPLFPRKRNLRQMDLPL